MWKSKKFIIIAVIIAALLVGGIAGVAIAQTNNNNNSSTTQTGQTFVARVAAILGIDQGKVQSAFDQAEKDMANEAMLNKLNSLVQQGKITQQQANQYEQWWQSRPNVNVPGLGMNGPGNFGRFGKIGGFRMPGGTPPTTTTPAQ